MKKAMGLIALTTLLIGCTSLISFFDVDNGENLEVEEGKTENISKGNSLRVEIQRPPTEQYDSTKSDVQLVSEAIDWGDCSFLFEYTQKENADMNLVRQANRVIETYTKQDSVTSRYRTRKMDVHVRKVPKELMDNVFIEPEITLPDIVLSLTNSVSDEFLKAKILHDWICDNIAYDTEMYFTGSSRPQDYISILKQKKAVCSGYTNLMNQMCKLAGIESIGINGYSKGLGYQGKIPNDTDHSWNAVKINNKWYLIDVTWDAGIVETKTFIKRYSSEWLFLDSRYFLYSHLPEDDAYQYFAPVLAIDEFILEPYVAGAFFQYGLALQEDAPNYNNEIDGSFPVAITLSNWNVSLSSELRTKSNRNIDAATWGIRVGNKVTFDFDVPNQDRYEGHIFARYKDEVRLQDRIPMETYEGVWLPSVEVLYVEGNPNKSKISEDELEYFKTSYYLIEENKSYYFIEDQFDIERNNAVLKIHKLLEYSTMWMENVLDFNVVAVPTYQGYGTGVLKYPQTYSQYLQSRDTQLISPIKGVLKAGTTEVFSVSSKDYSKFGIWIDGEKAGDLKRNSRTGFSELTLEIPIGATELGLYGLIGSNYSGLVHFDVVAQD